MKNLYNKNDDIRLGLKLSNGDFRCPACGEKVSNDKDACESCGAKLKMSDLEMMMNELREELGNLSDAEDIREINIESVEVKEEKKLFYEEVKEKKKCLVCGASADAESKVCPLCGTIFMSVKEPQLPVVDLGDGDEIPAEEMEISQEHVGGKTPGLIRHKKIESADDLPTLMKDEDS